MDIRLLATPWRRAVGAMFKHKLGDTVLLFVYPHSVPRLFHTLFCPPLRLVAMGGEGEVLYDRIIAPGRFVRLPASNFIVEADPAYELNLTVLGEMALNQPHIQEAVGTWQVESSWDRLLFAVLKDAVADIRRVHEAHSRKGKVCPDVLQNKFALWERGQLTNSAGFLLDLSEVWDIPETAISLSHQLLDVEKDCMDEITAASMAGIPWKGDFQASCLRCSQPASWRPVLDPTPRLQLAAIWRYKRPENHVPLCRRCAGWIGWQDQYKLRIDVAQGLWGMRFDAFWAWHDSARATRLPSNWDKEAYPLWPDMIGGRKWESGSGAFEHADPRPPLGVFRTSNHKNALSRVLNGRGGIVGKRGRGRFIPWSALLELSNIPLTEFI
ncbi:MAG: hypothetical protein PVF74_10785 [Anaerolineales bacterium]|jgi:hypothetical protein